MPTVENNRERLKIESQQTEGRLQNLLDFFLMSTLSLLHRLSRPVSHPQRAYTTRKRRYTDWITCSSTHAHQ